MNATVNAARHPQGIRRAGGLAGSWYGWVRVGVYAIRIALVVTAIIKIITTLLCLIMKNIIFGITFGFCLCRRRSSPLSHLTALLTTRVTMPAFWLAAGGVEATLKYA